jgi:hypothetical protein
MHRAFLPLFISLGLGCGPASGGLDAGTSTTTSTTTQADPATSTTGAPPTATTGLVTPDTGDTTSTTTTSTTSSTTTTDPTTTTDDPGTFIPIPDMGPPPCDAFAQDCPRGEKCMPYASDGGQSWNDSKCVDVMDDPAAVGEPCFVLDSGVSGLDNCELGAMCWNPDDQNQGTCIALCGGTADNPACPDGFNCTYGRSVPFGVCTALCDPLLQNCEPGDLCIPDPIDLGFLCSPDSLDEASPVHAPCDYHTGCAQGLLCVPPSTATECDPQVNGCCQPVCDVEAPNTCTGEAQTCVPYWDEGTSPPGYEHIGLCSVTP